MSALSSLRSLRSRLAAIRLERRDRLPYFFVGAWVLSMISVPIWRWVYGESAIPTAMTVTVLLNVAASLAVVFRAWPTGRALLTVTGVVGLAWLVEFVGHTTDFPFGAYKYTALLQPQLGGVPILIPFAWLMMLPPSWAVAFTLTRPLAARPPLRRAAFIAASAVGMTVWDLFLDPQMVTWGFWAWADPAGGYFGIPWSNYAGWLLAVTAITAAVRPAPLPLRPMVVIYGVTWALMTIGLAMFWGLPGPALIGGVVMGAILAAALYMGRDQVFGGGKT